MTAVVVDSVMTADRMSVVSRVGSGLRGPSARVASSGAMTVGRMAVGVGDSVMTADRMTAGVGDPSVVTTGAAATTGSGTTGARMPRRAGRRPRPSGPRPTPM